MTDPVSISPAGSFKGWRFYIWLKRNKETLKILASGLGGAIVYGVSSYSFMSSAAIGTISMAFGKLALDAIDYYFTDVALKT